MEEILDFIFCITAIKDEPMKQFLTFLFKNKKNSFVTCQLFDVDIE